MSVVTLSRVNNEIHGLNGLNGTVNVGCAASVTCLPHSVCPSCPQSVPCDHACALQEPV